MRLSFNLRFLLLQMLQMFAVCIGVSFLSPILYSYQYGEFTIGLILAAAALGAAALRPLLGYLNDRFCCARRIVITADLAGIVCFWLLTYSNSLALHVLAVIGLNATLVCMMNFVDSWALRLIQSGKTLNYGLTRAGGSLSYALGALIFGQICARYGYRPGSWILPVLYCGIVTVALSIPNPAPQTGRTKTPLRFSRAVGYLCGNRPFLLMLAAYFLMTQTSCAIDNFQSVRILSLGGTEGNVGTVLFVQSVSEMAVLIFYSRIKRAAKKPAAFWMAVGMAGFGLKALLLGCTRQIWQIYLIAILQSVSFGIVAPSIIDFILETVDPSVLSTSHLCFQSIGNGAAMVVGNLVCGYLAQRCGTGAMFRLICLCAFGGSLLALYVVRLRRRGQAGRERERTR